MKSRSLLLVVLACGALLAWAEGVTPEFEPFDLNLDFSHEPALSRLNSAWEIEPVEGWPGVYRLFAKEPSAPIELELPEAGSYQLRLKVTFLSPEGKVVYGMNQNPLGEWTPTKIGQAEKKRFFLPASMVRKGSNTLTLTTLGPARSVLYEQVRIRNFYSKVLKPHLYLVPKESGKSLSMPVVWILVSFGTGVLLWLALGWVWARLGSWPYGRALAWGTTSWVVLGVGLSAWLLAPAVSEYRLLATPNGYWILTTALWGIGQIPVFLASFLRRVLLLVPVGLRSTRKGTWWLWWLLRLTGRCLTQAVWWLLRLTGRCLTQAVWWFIANQSPIGYLKMSAGLFVVSLPVSWFRWTKTAEFLGHAAGVTLVISLVLLALHSMKNEDSAAP